jgi:hypothetical protein
VLIRRRISSRFSWSSLNYEWEVEVIKRLFRRDKSWYVEIYDHVRADLGRPRQDAVRFWVLKDRRSAEEFAERLAVALNEHGLQDLPAMTNNSG